MASYLLASSTFARHRTLKTSFVLWHPPSTRRKSYVFNHYQPLVWFRLFNRTFHINYVFHIFTPSPISSNFTPNANATTPVPHISLSQNAILSWSSLTKDYESCTPTCNHSVDYLKSNDEAVSFKEYLIKCLRLINTKIQSIERFTDEADPHPPFINNYQSNNIRF